MALVVSGGDSLLQNPVCIPYYNNPRLRKTCQYDESILSSSKTTKSSILPFSIDIKHLRFFVLLWLKQNLIEHTVKQIKVIDWCLTSTLAVFQLYRGVK